MWLGTKSRMSPISAASTAADRRRNASSPPSSGLNELWSTTSYPCGLPERALRNGEEYNALVGTHLSRSADVSATIGRDRVVDLVVGNRRPDTVHFNFVVVANHTTLGRASLPLNPRRGRNLQ